MFNKNAFLQSGWIRSRWSRIPDPATGNLTSGGGESWRRYAPAWLFRSRRLYGNGIPDGALTKKARCLSTASFLLTRDSVGIRTQDPQLRRLLLYPAELPNHPAYSAGKKAAPANRTANIGIFYYLAMFFLRKVSFGCKIAIIFAGNTEF